MSKSIAFTQYAADGSQVHVIVATGEVSTDESGNEIPVTVTHTFGAMPEYTDASSKTKFTIEDYVAQCEREVQALIAAEESTPKMVEVKR